jgi:hypothetical protein
VRYEEDDEDEEWGHNEDLASLERYSEDARDQALLVKARVGDEVEIVLVFRVSGVTSTSSTAVQVRVQSTAPISTVAAMPAGAGAGRQTGSLVLPLILLLAQDFSSSLSGMTATDPSRSVLPERAIIQSVDVVKGPFDPNNTEYLEKRVEWDEFKSRLQ